MEQIVTVELFGTTYRFRTESDITKAREITNLLENEVEKVMNQQGDKSTDLSEITMLIIAALNIAKENLDIKTKYSDMIQDVSGRSLNLIRILDVKENEK